MFSGNGEVAMEDGTNESDEGLPFGPIAELKFYDGDQRLPVFKWGLSKRMNTDKAAEILLRECSDRTGMATRLPTNISKRSVFVVDTSILCKVWRLKCLLVYGVEEVSIVQGRQRSMSQDGGWRWLPIWPRFVHSTTAVFQHKSLPSARKSIINEYSWVNLVIACGFTRVERLQCLLYLLGT